MPKVLGLECYPVISAPEAYDIIWVNFPYHEEPWEPGPDRHPGLILSKKVFKHEGTGVNYASLQVMYGTSSSQKTIRQPWEYLRVHNSVALDQCGLFCDTYFVVDRVQKMLWCEEYMPNTEYGTPILGKLPMEYILQLKKLKEIRDAMLGIGDNISD